MMITIKLAVGVFLLSLIVVKAAQDTPQVQISQGLLQGKHFQSNNGRQFSAFRGIPFAKPPSGELRFKTPVPADAWEGTLDASKPHAICPQYKPLSGDLSVFGSEDCLYLNVYTPQLPDTKKQLLPVIFYIHGGAWIFGSGDMLWYGPEILLDKDVVLVVPNYRLGALGFLTTGDGVVPGNNGLKDQALALKWTKDNIAAFGGDPDGITVVGHSAGGASSHLLAISPLTKDLIKGAIAQSGTAVASWAVDSLDDAVRNSKKLAKFVSCPSSSSEEMVKCLRKVDVSDILQQDVKFLEWAVDPAIPFKPVVEPDTEGAFLPEHPHDIISSGKAASVPFLTGITTEDGALKSAGYYTNPKWIEDHDKDFNRVVPIVLRYEASPFKDKISKKIRKYYFGNKAIDSSTKSELTDMYTDVIFSIGADVSVKLHSQHKNQPIYYYLFAYRGSESHTKLFGDSTHNYGVCHADELLYLFTQSTLFPNYKPTDSDKAMSEIMTTLWVNFAKTGNPTPETTSLIPVKWEPVQSEKLEYYFIKSETDIEMAEGLFRERIQFWNDLILNLGVPDEDKDEL